jgi:hypothetical protein
MAKPVQRSVQTFRVSRELLRRAAKLDGQRPGEWARLTVERVARDRIAQAERNAAAARLLRDIGAGEFEEDDPAVVTWADELRHRR